MANEQIKRAFAETEYTPENIQELQRCMNDPVHFICNYVWVQHPKYGKTLFKLYDYQKELVEALKHNRWVMILMARQMGKTQTTSMFLLWYAMFHRDQICLIASKNNAHAIEIMDRIRFAYEELPHWLKAGCKYYNKHNIEFDNGSKIISQSTTEKTGRGYSISKLYLDELAFVNPNIQENMWASLAPTLSTGGSAIISSTPNGDTELFAQLWRAANSQKNSFIPLTYTWDRHPERGPEYYKEMLGQLGELKFRQEVLIEFLSSDELLISSLVLSMMREKEPVEETMGFKLWRKAADLGGAGKTYLVGIDPATGSGSDFTSIQVIEFPALEQVAELRMNTVSIPLIYSKIKWLLKMLTKPDSRRQRADVLWSFERNGVGEALIAMIQSDDSTDGGIYLDNTELYSEGNGRLGIYTSGKNKLVSCMQLKTLIEKISGGIIINSKDLIFELKNFIASGGTYAAKSGATDDAVMALLVVIRLFARLSSYDDKAKRIMYETVAPDSDIKQEYPPGPESEDHFPDEPMPMVF